MRQSIRNIPPLTSQIDKGEKHNFSPRNPLSSWDEGWASPADLYLETLAHLRHTEFYKYKAQQLQYKLEQEASTEQIPTQ